MKHLKTGAVNNCVEKSVLFTDSNHLQGEEINDSMKISH